MKIEKGTRKNTVQIGQLEGGECFSFPGGKSLYIKGTGDGCCVDLESGEGSLLSSDTPVCREPRAKIVWDPE